MIWLWLAIAFALGNLLGVIEMAILSGRLERRLDLKEKAKQEREWAEAQGLLFPENKKEPLMLQHQQREGVTK